MWTARRYAVPMRCCSHPELSEPAVVVLAGGPMEAEVRAAQKLAEKHLTTKWVGAGEAVAIDAVKPHKTLGAASFQRPTTEFTRIAPSQHWRSSSRYAPSDPRDP